MTAVRFSADVRCGSPLFFSAAFRHVSGFLPHFCPGAEPQVRRDEAVSPAGSCSGRAGPSGTLLRATQHGIVMPPTPTQAHTRITSSCITLVTGNFIPVISHLVRYCTDAGRAGFFS